MPTVEEIAAQIVTREGGYVNDPADPGGATKYGVTIGTMRRLGIDFDQNGRTDVGDLRLLTRQQAARIYVDHYFRAPKLDLLPAIVQASVFDMHVNAGTTAVKLLQKLIARMGFGCADDGLVGPRTAVAAAEAAQAAPRHLADAYGIARRTYYYALADARPASRKYARRKDGGKGGWIVRAEEFIAPRYHLTEAAHRERTAKWA